MGVKNINVAVGGHQGGDYPKVYNTVYIKPNIPFALQVTEPNTKYVIRHKIDLGGKGDAVSDVDFTNAGTHEIAGVEYYYVPFTANGKPYTLLDDSCVFITSDWTGLSERTITPDEGTVFMIGSVTGGLHTGAYINAEVVTMPENCILEFDGGSLDNGVIVGQDTVFINVGDVKIWGDNLVRLGTWKEHSGGGINDREYAPEHYSGYGRKTLQLKGGSNILTQDDFDQDHTIYAVLYDFDLDGADIQMPEGCVLDFEGGNFTNGTLISDDTEIIGQLPENTNTLYGQYYKDKKPLNYNLKVTQTANTCVDYAFMAPADYVDYGFYPQGLTIFNYNNQKYHLIGGHATVDSQQYAHILLFDSNYKYLGSTQLSEPDHGGNYTVKGDKIYKGMINKVVVFNISDVIDCCLAESNTPHNTEYAHRPTPIQTIPVNMTVCAIDYDANNKEFLLVDGLSYCSVYDEDFNLKRYSECYIEQYLREELHVYCVFQGAAYKNGIVYCNFWVSDWNFAGSDHSRPRSLDWSGSIICTFDSVTDKVVSWDKLSLPYQDPECEGLCKNPDNDNELYFTIGAGANGINISAFCKVSLTDSVFGMTVKRENTGGFLNNIADFVYRVDNTYDYSYGPSDGSTLKPYYCIGDAMAMMVANGANAIIGIQSATKEYILPRFHIHDGLLSIRGIDNNIPTLVGGIDPEGGKVDIRKAIIKTKSAIRLTFGGFLYLNNVQLVNDGSNTGVYVLDGSTLIADEVTVSGYDTGFDVRRSNIKSNIIHFNNCTNRGIAVQNSTVTIYSGYFDGCETGIWARRNDLNLGYLYFNDVNYCINVDDSFINTWRDGIKLSGNIGHVIIKDEAFRGRINLMMMVHNTEELEEVFDLVNGGNYYATSVGFTVTRDDVQYNGMYIEKGTYTYANPGFMLAGYPVERIIEDNGNFVFIPNKGTYDQRPTLNSNYAGFMYYDTTLNLNVYWNGSEWVEQSPNNIQFRFNYWKKLGELTPESTIFAGGAVTISDSRYNDSSPKWTELDGQAYRRIYNINTLPFNTGDIIMFVVKSPVRNSQFVMSAKEIQEGQEIKVVNIFNTYNADVIYKKAPTMTDCNAFYIIVNGDTKYFDGTIEVYKKVG